MLNIKKIVFLFFILIRLKLNAQEILTNQSVISLSQAKISADIIIDKIKSSNTKFDLSTQGTIDLTKAQIRENILETMLLSSTNMPILTNKDIIELYTVKVSRSIIQKKIQYSESNFDSSSEGLVELKLAKIPDQLVGAMLNPQKAAKESNINTNLIAGVLSQHPIDLNLPSKAVFDENGIYYEDYTNKPIKYELLEPTVTNNTKKGSAGEAIANNYTAGLVGTKQKVGLTNPSSNFIIEDKPPVFYMVFSGNTRKDVNNVAEAIFYGAASPNDRVKPSKRGREFVIGRESSVTSESGFSDGVVHFRFKKS
jgi:hypothetical protein